ncbi:MAG TPA: class I SAM-dependent methyltransferase [Oculatellaceae cyanobacterium]|jgi:SAM-dependent methyltransferase
MMFVDVSKIVLKNTLKLSLKGQKCGPHLTRYSIYKRLEEVMKNNSRCGKILSISHSTALCEKLLDTKNSQVIEANYPDYNILSLPFRDNEFDYVVSDQVLEHVEGNPQSAIDESLRVLKPGGIAIHTTCFINPIHDAPGDFWRFTPEALKLLCRKFSKIIDAGGWGNPYVWLLVGLDMRFIGIPEASWHPIHKIATYNDENWPIVTWVIAQK